MNSNSKIISVSGAPSRPWHQPTDDDFHRIVGKDKNVFLDRVLGVIENEIVPKTREGAAKGNKLFGGAILNKSDLSTVVVATNTETEHPLLHGEIPAINAFYGILGTVALAVITSFYFKPSKS